jgi:hypothetical protein
MKYYPRLLFILALSALILTTPSCKKDVNGCTDPTAENYNPDADVDDGNCVIKGCTDPMSDNFNPNATQDDGTCTIKGCTNPKANNYNPDANSDDGSCEIEGCDDPEAHNFDPEVNISNLDDCIYRKDIYKGTFIGSMVCVNPIITDLIGGEMLTFFIKEIPNENNEVVFEVDFEVDIIENPTGTIDENLVMHFENDQEGVEYDVDGDGTPELYNIYTEGTFMLDEETMNIMTGIFHIEVKQDIGGTEVVFLESDCDVEAVRQ